jgi:hypothetical protein
MSTFGYFITSYKLISTVRFPTRSVNGTSSAIDNIFIDKTHIGNYTLHPLINGLSDHDGQILGHWVTFLTKLCHCVPIAVFSMTTSEALTG